MTKLFKHRVTLPIAALVALLLVNTPMTVPAMLNLPPMSDVPPSTTARIASSSM